MNKVLSFQQIFGDAFIIDQPARRLPEGRIIQQRVGAVGGIKHQVVLLGGRDAQHLHAGFILQGGYLVSAEVAGHVGIPCWISRRREAGSGTFLIIMLLIFGAPVGELALASSTMA